MNSSAVRSSARVFRLVDLDSVRDDVEPTPVENETPPVVEGVRLAPLRWPEPIGSGPAAANADQVKPGQVKPQVQLRVKVHAPLPRMPKGQMATLPVSFSGRPTEYARLWFRNVILVLLSLGLYAPWARVHTQRYFLRRTQVAGECLDYHADPAALLPRYVLTGGLVAGVIGAWAGSRLAGMMALSLALAVVPLLVYMTLTHRVAHISWAGRRLQFDGRCQGVYQAMWAPLTGACLVAWLLMATLAWNRPGGWFAWGVVAALWGMAVPTFVWVYFQYRQHHLVLGPVRLLWQGHRMAVATLFVKTLAWFAMVCMLTAGLGAIVLAAVEGGKVPVLRSQRSALSDLLEGGGTVLTRTIEALDRVNRVLSDKNIKTFSASLSDVQVKIIENQGENVTSSLLELAEARGLQPEFSCRAGTCGSCKTKVLQGAVSYLTPPTAPVAEDEALICCAVPAAEGEALQLAL